MSRLLERPACCVIAAASPFFDAKLLF